MLFATLGREPTAAELQFARDKELYARMTAMYGSPPTDAEFAAARDAELILRLTASLGREPTEEEIAAARDADIRLRLTTALGREPTEVEMEAAREAALQERLLGTMGRPPTLLELEAAREASIKARLRAELGREPTEAEMEASREAALHASLVAKLGREPTQAELQMRRAQSKKLLVKLDGGAEAHAAASEEVAARKQRKAALKRHAAAVLANQLQREHMRYLGLLPQLSPRDSSEMQLCNSARRALLQSRMERQHQSRSARLGQLSPSNKGFAARTGAGTSYDDATAVAAWRLSSSVADVSRQLPKLPVSGPAAVMTSSRNLQPSPRPSLRPSPRPTAVSPTSFSRILQDTCKPSLQHTSPTRASFLSRSPRFGVPTEVQVPRDEVTLPAHGLEHGPVNGRSALSPSPYEPLRGWGGSPEQQRMRIEAG